VTKIKTTKTAMQSRIIKIVVATFFLPSLLFAQFNDGNKYALILGLNDYYIQPGVKHGSSLHGCVNDANSMRGLLINRFGFTSANIQMLYNENVTRKNVIEQMHVILEKCKPGDAFVFFYSGHGAWMSNPMNKDDAVKRGMSQSMVMSDLYTPNLECLLTDEMLKQVINEFVDKKVIVTSLFDCCYSGNLSMGYMSDYWSPLLRPIGKGILLNGINYVPEKIKPKGCVTDNSGHIVDEKDSDLDGIPDCMDWEINSPFFNLVDSLGVSKEGLSAEDFINLSERSGNNTAADKTKEDRSFNLRDALKVSYPLLAKRPSDRKDSKFLSMSAASDKETGAEISDENEMKHGAFTKALLTVYKKNPADLPLSALLKKISLLMKEQGYVQTPTYHFDPARLNGNLIGTNSSEFSNEITATCIAAKNGMITLDKGSYSTIDRGNIFKNVNSKGNQKVQVTEIYNDSAVAIDKTGLIKGGDKLMLTDHYSVSNPVVKIFIPTMNCSVAGFQAFFKKRIKPFVDQNNYGDFHFVNAVAMNSITIFYDEKIFDQFSIPSLSGGSEGVSNFVFLPVPSYLFNVWNSSLAKDQNIELVNKPEDADFVLYLNYIKARSDHPAAFVFYFHPRIDDPAYPGIPIFSRENLQVTTLDLTSKSLQTLSQKLYELTKKTFRYKTTHWINDYPRR
jgi:hypothetical protein